MSSDPIDAFLGLVVGKGLAAVSLRDVAEAAGEGLADLYARFPDKRALLAGFLARIDREVLAGTPSSIDPEETARDRLFDVLMRRFDALKPHRPVLRALLASRDPFLLARLAPATRRSMAAMLEAAGLASDGMAGAARIAGLLAIHLQALRIFLKDDTGDLSKTMAALDGRLKRAEGWVQSLDSYGKYLRPRASAA